MASGMERSVSVEDFLGGLLRLQSHTNTKSGMGQRTDSEAAFQEFLRRIPSAGALAGQGDEKSEKNPWGSSANLSFLANNSSVPSFQAYQQDGNGASMTRIASLEQLRYAQPPGMDASPGAAGMQQLHAQHQQQQQQQAQAHGSNGAAAATMPQQMPPNLLPNHMAVLASMGMGSMAMPGGQQGGPLQMPNGVNLLQALPAYQQQLLMQQQPVSDAQGHKMAPAPPQQATPTTSSGAAPGDAKNEQRRSRRMLSNRESARRSRKRKQEQLNELEGQINDLEEKNGSLTSQCEQSSQQIQGLMQDKIRLEGENRHLISILTHLRDTLGHEKIRLHIPPSLAGALDSPSSVPLPLDDADAAAAASRPEKEAAGDGADGERALRNGAAAHQPSLKTQRGEEEQSGHKRAKHSRANSSSPAQG